MSTRVLATLIAGCAAALVAPAAAIAGTLDQQQPTTGGGALNAHSNQSVAQTFTAGLSGKLDQVDLHLGTLNTPTDPLSVELRNASGGLPGSTVLASQSVPASSVPALPAFVPITFATPASVAAGTQYAIVAYSATVYPQIYNWSEGPTANPYAGGADYYTGSSPPTTAWIPDGTADFAFKTYVATPVTPVTPATPTGQQAAALKKCKKKHSKRARRKCRKKASHLPT